MNLELPDEQAGFRRGRGEIKRPASAGPERKQWSPRKTSISASLMTVKPSLPLEKETAAQSSLPAWRIPGTESCLAGYRVGHDLATKPPPAQNL